jgi:hypothetical protein
LNTIFYKQTDINTWLEIMANAFPHYTIKENLGLIEGRKLILGGDYHDNMVHLISVRYAIYDGVIEYVVYYGGDVK